MSFEKYTKEQETERLKLLGLYPAEADYDCSRFQDADAGTLEKLIEKGYLDPEDQQNDAPTAAEFLAWLKAHPGFTAHGCVISNRREDRRVTIEGVEFDGEADAALIADFVTMFRFADELNISPSSLYCWYD